MKASASLISVLLMLLSAIPAQSQTGAHPEDPAAAQIGTFNLRVTPTSGSSNEVTIDIFVFRTSAGRTDYVMDISTIDFANDCGTVDQLSTAQLFAILSQSIIAQGVIAGYTSCPSSCSTPATSVVYQPACVERTGSGCSTAFTSCNTSAFCKKTYTVCCAGGPSFPVITYAGSDSPGCSGMGSCQSTCQ